VSLRLILVALPILSCVLHAADLRIGALGRGSLSGDTQWSRTAYGGGIGIGLPWDLSIEWQGLYQRIHADRFSSSTSAGTATVINLRASLFESPLLLQKAFAVPGPVRPTVSGGPTLRAISDASYGSVDFVPNPGASADARRDLPDNPYQVGVAFGAGLRINTVARLQFHPQIRYTRWTVRNRWNTNPNQVDFVLGIYLRLLK
jgi:hypothetical protein